MLRFIEKTARPRLFSARISIHLMLRFIVYKGQQYDINSDFNTSHVTVYRRFENMYDITKTNFNTSHVTVYRYFADIYERVYRISIHPMLRFIWTFALAVRSDNRISIHPMLRFI